MTGVGGRGVVTERLFHVAIALKGADGGLQLLAAIVLVFVPPRVLLDVAHVLVNRDLVGDPAGSVATHLQTAVHDVAVGGSRWFVIVYLLAHGVVKLGLVAALWREVMPAYPVAVVVLSVFVGVELQRAVHTSSIVLAVLAALDVFIIVFVVKEYLQLRGRRARVG